MSPAPSDESWSHPGTELSSFAPQYSPSLGGALEFQYELPVFEMGYTVEEPSAFSSAVDGPELSVLLSSLSLLEVLSSLPPLSPPSLSELASLPPLWPPHPARPVVPSAPEVMRTFRRDTPPSTQFRSDITCIKSGVY
jgi:hypothetical protein